MKINILSAFLIFLSVNVIAQNSGNLPDGTHLTSEKTKDTNRKGFSLEPIAGVGSSESVQHGTNNLGWKFGCGLTYMFNEHWGISSGLQVQEYSTKVVSSTVSQYINNNAYYSSFWESYYVSTNYNFIYLELPIMARYMSKPLPKHSFFVEAGFIIGYSAMSQEESPTFYVTSDSPNPYTLPYGTYSPFAYGNVTPVTNLLNLQGHLALGLITPCSKRCSIVVDASINRGFTNVGNSSKDFLNIGNPEPYYYYQNKSYTSSTIFNYGTNSSFLFELRLNIKLGKITNVN